jgi:hypothetical protein
MTRDKDWSDRFVEWAREHPLALLGLVLVFIYLSLTGALNDIFAAEPASAPLPLAAPRLVPLSGADATEAAQLLGSSVARLYAEQGEDQA